MALQEVTVGEFKAKAPRLGYARPSIDLGNQGVREWKDVYVKDLEPGDIVANLGKVISISRIIRPFVDVLAGVPNSYSHHMYELDIVKAFVKRSD